MNQEDTFIEWMAVKDIAGRFDPKNAKDHDVGEITESLKRFGYIRKIELNDHRLDKFVLLGHGTTKALAWLEKEGIDPLNGIRAENGRWEVQVVRGHKIPPKEAKAYRIADNRLTEIGGYDNPQLIDNLIEIEKGRQGLRGIGFDNDDLDMLIRIHRPEEIPEDPGAQLDKAAELQKKWQVERGQIWEIGKHRLMCGDSTKEEDVGRLVKDYKIELIVTDPPYGIEYQGGAGNKVKRTGIVGDDSPDLYNLFLSAIGLSANCAIYLWHAGREAEAVYSALRANGISIRSQIIWNKLDPHYGAYMAQYKQRHEPCLYGVIGTPGFCGPTNEVTVWDVKQPSHNDLHLTQKPVELMQRAIGNHKAKIVYDGFLGSGTTMVAAEQLNRVCYGMEIHPPYCAVTLERMQGMGLKPELLK